MNEKCASQCMTLTGSTVDDACCKGWMDTKGEMHDICGEPCSFVMKKVGHGLPPFLGADSVLQRIRRILILQARS